MDYSPTQFGPFFLVISKGLEACDSKMALIVRHMLLRATNHLLSRKAGGACNSNSEADAYKPFLTIADFYPKESFKLEALSKLKALLQRRKVAKISKGYNYFSCKDYPISHSKLLLLP